MAELSTGDSSVDDALEVGCLSVQLVASRNVRVPGGGMVDMFLNTQVNPYCKISLGGCEIISGMGVQTKSGHTWNREQIFFPVKVPLSCVVGAAEQLDASGLKGSGAKKGDAAASCSKYSGSASGPSKGAADDVSCASEHPRAAHFGNAWTAQDVWARLTLRAQVFHRDEGAGRRVRADGRIRATAAEKAAAAAPAQGGSASKDRHHSAGGGKDNGKSDQLLGECSINLVEVVSGRAPHLEEWVPLDTEGHLRLSLDYDSVGATPVPGDSVVLLCLSNRLDYFPLPVWDIDDDPARPGSLSWLWARGASRRSGGRVTEGFRVEEAGDDFFLLSYPTPEGWRCAVEVHRFLVHSDPTAPARWTLSGMRDHAIASPAAAAVRDVIRQASRQESLWDGATGVASQLLDGVWWTAFRWWHGGRTRIRDDVLFAAGVLDQGSFEQSERRGVEEEKNDAPPADGDSPASMRSRRLSHNEHRGSEGRDDRASSTGAQDVRMKEESKDNGSMTTGGLDNLQARNGQAKNDERGRPSSTSPGKLRVPSPKSATPSEGSNSEHSGVDDDAAATLSEESNGPPAAFSKKIASNAHIPPADLPQHVCPITRCSIEDPAVAADGYTYEREAIERWLSEHNTSPVTGKPLDTKVVFKNWSLVSDRVSA